MGVAVLAAETKGTHTEVAGDPEIFLIPCPLWCVASWKFLSTSLRSQTF
jgi:hypothetical protein